MLILLSIVAERKMIWKIKQRYYFILQTLHWIRLIRKMMKMQEKDHNWEVQGTDWATSGDHAWKKRAAGKRRRRTLPIISVSSDGYCSDHYHISLVDHWPLHSCRSTIMAMEHAGHSAPYIGCSVRNTKTLETRWIGGYLIGNRGQRCWLTNDSRGIADWWGKRQWKHRLCNVRERQEWESFQICYKTRRPDERHRNLMWYLKREKRSNIHRSSWKILHQWYWHSVMQWFNKVKMTVWPENI